ncbi:MULTISPECIES: phage tail sheath family protein [Mycetohabitans]|uniref:phage tail sheath family protein n=1 Tax=Mycetohabitans TaxID=2571159 RepID=UPI001F2F8600|nr:phage tail sheath C-terminal domain-containing protein [Mycetohabitans sp. B3]MCF2134579.1 hypothetical protein [Mycetohabitans sp. B3]
MDSPFSPGVVFSQEPAVPTPTELPTAVPLFVGYTDTPEESKAPTVYNIGTFADYQDQLGGPPPKDCCLALYSTVRHYFDNGGGRCYVLSVGSYASVKQATQEAIAQALQRDLVSALAQASEATLLAIPDLVLLESGDENVLVDHWTRVWEKMLCVHRHQRGVFALLDAPSDPDVARQCLDRIAKAGLDEALAHGAAYWPQLVTNYEKDDGSWITVPPSGALAAAIQCTDRERGIWKAPANVLLARVIRPARPYQQAGVFGQEPKINLIRSFPARGVRIWGCRTLIQSPPWCYVQVRRTLSYIEAHLSEIGRFAVFESNNAITWFKLKALARAWLRQLWQAGGLFGAQEDEAFRLLLGLGESMTEEDVQAGRLIMKVFLAAYYPAEFIELRLQLQTSESMMSPDMAPPHKSVMR